MNPQPKHSTIRLPPLEYKALCQEVFERDGDKCRVPGCRSRNGLHAHHIVFRSHSDGDDIIQNLITMCWRCHGSLHDRQLFIEAVDGEEIDANKPVKFVLVNGWQPRNK